MITYPSTHGVFETAVTEICALVHDAGGQVYVDGANLNALVGLAKPGQVRRRRLAPEPAQDLLHPARRRRSRASARWRCARTWRRTCPSHPLRPEAGPLGRGHADGGVGPVSGAPWGSAGILPIPWAYIRMMGADGLLRRDPDRHPLGQLRRRPAARALPGALHRARTASSRTSASSTCAAITKADGRDRRRRRQAAHRLRLPRADDVVPGRGHAHGRADRERGPRRARPVLRRDDRDPGGDRRGGRRAVAARGQPAAQRPAHGRLPDRRVGPRRTRRGWRRSPSRACARTSTGRRCGASTAPTATATWSAPARAPEEFAAT